MALFLATLRRISLGGIIVLIISLFLRKPIPQKQFYILLAGLIIAYLFFMFITWIRTRKSVDEFSEQYGMDIPKNGFVKTLFRGIVLDVLSPIVAIVDMFRQRENKVLNLFTTYIIVLGYLAIWFFIIKPM